jgi:hypothetical protein
MDAWIPICRKYDENEDREKHNEDKIGGEKPFLGLDETWPLSTDGIPMRFVLQLTVPFEAQVPFKGKTIRLFMDPCEEQLSSDNIHVTYIDYSEPFQDYLKAPSYYGESYGKVLKPFPAFKVVGLDKHKELYSGPTVLSEPSGFSEPSSLSEPSTGIKIGGFPSSWQDCGDYYLKAGMLLQVGECDFFEWYYGDSGEIHINPDTKQVDGDCG